MDPSISPSFLGETLKLLGKPANSTSTFGQVVPPQSSPSPLPFIFGSQSPSKTELTATFVGRESTPEFEFTLSTRQLFIFGQHNEVAPTERPVTPPRNSDIVFRMEESPTREIQQSSEANKPALALGEWIFIRHFYSYGNIVVWGRTTESEFFITLNFAIFV